MFNAPDIISQIPEIKIIYETNEMQERDLEIAIETIDNNLFLNTMSIDVIEEWEEILDIIPYDDDTIDDRRFRVKAKIIERVPYSLRVLRRKLDTLSPEGYKLTLSYALDAIEVKIALKSKRMIDAVEKSMEDIVPLNMLLDCGVLWNNYELLNRFTHEQLSSRTYASIREDVFE